MRFRGRLLMLLALLPACGPEPAPVHPVVLIGVDGLEWSVLRPLLRAGRLPNLARLVERGASGELFTLRPALSPAIWTSVVTGVRPERHGITGFISAEGVPFTSSSRNGRALWNIASQYGRKTLSVGWWMTWPAEPIDGWMVAPYSSAGQTNLNWKGNLQKGLRDQTWPRELIDEIYPEVRRLLEERNFLEVDRRFFGGVDLDLLDEQERSLVAQTRWSVSADAAFTSIATRLLSKPEVTPDLTLVYLGGPDVASHRFWRYRSPEEFEYPIGEASVTALSEIIDRFYAEADRMIGELIAAAPAQANLIVCSDHGFRPYSRDRRDPSGISAHHLEGPPGVIILAGPDIEAGVGREAILGAGDGDPLPLGRVLEITPLVLYLLDIPRARRMDVADGGSLLRQAVSKPLLARRSPDPTIDSHDLGFRPASRPEQVTPEMTDDILKWMDQLGYATPEAREPIFRDVGPDDR